MSEVDAELAALIADDETELEPVSTQTLDDIRELAQQYRDLTDRKKALETGLDEVKKQLETLNGQIKQVMEAAGTTSVRVDGIGLLYTQTDPYPTIKDPARFIEWADANGFGHLARRAVHPSTARSFWKEQLESGGLLPPEDVAQAFLNTNVRLRKK